MPTETVAEKLVKLNAIKADLKTQIEAKGVTVGDSSFEEYPGLVEDIPPTLFRKLVDRSITSVTADDLAGVTSIGYYAFRGCEYLISVEIPDSVTSIGHDAFWGCTRLISVTIYATTPPTLANSDAFSGNYPIYVPAASVNTYKNTVNWSALASRIQAIQEFAFTSNGDGTCYVSGIGTVTDTDITIPSVSPAGDSVTSIGSEAFKNCTALTSVTIPNSVTSIEESAFYSCTSLTSITIPDSVTSVETQAFYNCTSLTGVYITDLAKWCVISFGSSAANPLYYAHNLYLNSEMVVNLVIPGSVTGIGRYAFYGCTSMKSVTIPGSVTGIGGYAFYGCASLVEVCNLSNLDITAGGSSNGYVGYYAKHVYNEGESYLHTTADGYIFYENGNEVYLMGYIGTATELALPEKYNEKTYGIYQYAFYDYKPLTSIAISASTTSIGEDAFHWCASLTGVYITDLAKWCVISFGNIYANPLYYAHNLYLNNELVTDLVIPSGVTNIGSYAFAYCLSLQSVEIPNSVTSIGNNAFWNCTHLSGDIVIPDSVTSIGRSAFDQGGYETKRVIIGSGISTIEFAAFRYNYRMQYVTIRAIATSTTPPPTLINQNAFDSTNSCPIYVLAPDIYRVATNWSALSSRIFPLVARVENLNDIDTTTYQQACVIGPDESYKEYTWDGSQWNEVT